MNKDKFGTWEFDQEDKFSVLKPGQEFRFAQQYPLARVTSVAKDRTTGEVLVGRDGKPMYFTDLLVAVRFVHDTHEDLDASLMILRQADWEAIDKGLARHERRKGLNRADLKSWLVEMVERKEGGALVHME